MLRALSSLEALTARPSFEVIVANLCGEGVASQIEHEFPRTLVVAVADGSTIAQARQFAIERAPSDAIVVLNERYSVDDEWLHAVERAASSESDVTGGCVAPALEMTCARWAMFLSEYAHIAPPMPGSRLDRPNATMLPGGNVVYQRAAFSRASMADSLWELDFHAKLYDAGASFERSTEMTARWGCPHTTSEYVAERIRVSREWAAKRAMCLPLPQRLISALTRLALPALVVARIGRNIGEKHYGMKFLAALPWILFFSLLQMGSEIAGYLQPRASRHSA